MLLLAVPSAAGVCCTFLFLEAMIDDFLIKINCASMSFEFSFYMLNIYLMKTLFANVIFLVMLYIKVGQYISLCLTGKLPNHLWC